MANETKTHGPLKVLAAGQQVERAAIAADGTVNVRHSKAQLQSVDVADVDLLLAFADGSYVVIANGALDAISGTPHNVTFTDSKEALGDLFKQVGIVAADLADPSFARIAIEVDQRIERRHRATLAFDRIRHGAVSFIRKARARRQSRRRVLSLMPSMPATSGSV